METKQLSSLFETAEKWKKILETLTPDSLVEINIDIKAKTFFIWYFENKLSSGFTQNIKMEFLLNGIVEVKTQSDLGLETLNSFEEAEKWITDYFKLPQFPTEPSFLLKTLPSLSSRNREYKKWLDLFNKLKPYGVEIDTEREYCPFALYLPTIESILNNTGDFEIKDEGVSFEPGMDWAKLLKEEIIVPLKKMYDFSTTEVPDLTEELKLIQLCEKHKELYYSLDNWIAWINEISLKVPFSVYPKDTWSALSVDKCHFDGEKIISGISVGGNNAIFSVSFGHDYLFNGDQLSISLFSGKLYFFTNNVAALTFSGTSLWGMKYREEKFHLYGRYAGGMGEPFGFNEWAIPEIKPVFINGSWNEVANEFIKLIQSINGLLGDGIETLPMVIKK